MAEASFPTSFLFPLLTKALKNLDEAIKTAGPSGRFSDHRTYVTTRRQIRMIEALAKASDEATGLENITGIITLTADEYAEIKRWTDWKEPDENNKEI